MALEEFILLGDALWLDFVNSARGRTTSPPDLLPDHTAFARWCRLQHLDPADLPSFPKVIEFRGRLTELAEALHDGAQPPAAAIAAVTYAITVSPFALAALVLAAIAVVAALVIAGRRTARRPTPPSDEPVPPTPTRT